MAVKTGTSKFSVYGQIMTLVTIHMAFMEVNLIYQFLIHFCITSLRRGIDFVNASSYFSAFNVRGRQAKLRSKTLLAVTRALHSRARQLFSPRAFNTQIPWTATQ